METICARPGLCADKNNTMWKAAEDAFKPSLLKRAFSRLGFSFEVLQKPHCADGPCWRHAQGPNCSAMFQLCASGLWLTIQGIHRYADCCCLLALAASGFDSILDMHSTSGCLVVQSSKAVTVLDAGCADPVCSFDMPAGFCRTSLQWCTHICNIELTVYASLVYKQHVL